jgi:hypothetical protein
VPRRRNREQKKQKGTKVSIFCQVLSTLGSKEKKWGVVRRKERDERR